MRKRTAAENRETLRKRILAGNYIIPFRISIFTTFVPDGLSDQETEAWVKKTIREHLDDSCAELEEVGLFEVWSPQMSEVILEVMREDDLADDYP